MKVWTKPMVGLAQGGEMDTGRDGVFVEDGQCVGSCQRAAGGEVSLYGFPSDELLEALTCYFGSDRRILWPNVILDENNNPTVYGDDDE